MIERDAYGNPVLVIQLTTDLETQQRSIEILGRKLEPAELERVRAAQLPSEREIERLEDEIWAEIHSRTDDELRALRLEREALEDVLERLGCRTAEDLAAAVDGRYGLPRLPECGIYTEAELGDAVRLAEAEGGTVPRALAGLWAARPWPDGAVCVLDGTWSHLARTPGELLDALGITPYDLDEGIEAEERLFASTPIARLSDAELERAWADLGDILVDDAGMTLEDFHGFPAGTDREEIWLEFDQAYPAGVHALMFPGDGAANLDELEAECGAATIDGGAAHPDREKR